MTVIDFTVTMGGLEDQLLGVVISKEKPELEEKRAKLLAEVNGNKKTMKQLEENLLDRLSNATGNLLDDTELIQVLANTKKTATEVAENLRNATGTTGTTGNSRRIEQLSTTLKLLQDGVAEIFVRTIFDTTITVAIDGMLTTDDLLTRIGERMPLSLWYGLVFAGRHIEAGRSLMDYNIQNRCTLQQTHPLLGGTRDGADTETRSMLRVEVAARDGSARSQTPPRRTISQKEPSASSSHRSTTPPRSISQKEARGTPPAEDEEPVDVLVQTVSVDEESDSEDKGQYLLVAKVSGGDDEEQVAGKAS